jgi:ATP-dependent helicase/nuclease subunit B
MSGVDGVSNNITGKSNQSASSPPPSNAAQIHSVPYEQNPLAYLARLIIQRNKNNLPDLTDTVVLLSQARAAPWFRRELLHTADQSGHAALLGPRIETLTSWTKQAVLPGIRTVSDETRELLLVEALREHPDLYGEGSAYSLAASLMELFDDLTGHYIQLPTSLTQFQQQLEQAYGIGKRPLSALGKEATLVHTLWQAMHQQLQAQQALDTPSAHIQKLAHTLSGLQSQQHIYIAGFHDFTKAQWQWLQQLAERVSLVLVAQGNPSNYPFADASVTNHDAYSTAERFFAQIDTYLKSPSSRLPPGQIELDFNEPAQDPGLSKTAGSIETSALTQCLESIFPACADSLNAVPPKSLPLKKRAAEFAARFPHDPLVQQLRIYEASHSEAEANAVDVQIRRWLSQGLNHIGIVTENRRLARRVRALLERAGITLQDSAGWALSTTSAATIIERWLQCIEADFHHLPFLDFLKSPFVFKDRERPQYLQTVYHLEKSVIHDENVADGLQRYRLHTGLVRQRLSDTMAKYLDAIPPLLDVVEQAARPLTESFHQTSQPPAAYLRALLESLQPLGVIEALHRDAAGNQLLNVLDKLSNATQSISLDMQWVEFRSWLGSHLEHAFFQPTGSQSPIQLMSLAQSDLQQFDALIIAGAEQQHLPGTPTYSPFFNDAVRHALGIPTVQQKHANQFFYFRRLLQSTRASDQPRILMTRTLAENGEELIPSPWLEAIQSFHALAYPSSLWDSELQYLVEQIDAQWCDTSAPLPHPMEPHPVAEPAPELLPKTMSATSYQQVMNCPYQFFAARCLRLSPPDTVREMLQKDEFGSKVHACLQAFHSKVAGLPGPFDKPFSEANKQTAIDLLELISHQVFEKDIEDNFIHRGWLKRWLELIPRYLDWQIEQSKQWQVYKVEKNSERIALSGECQIKGQLDRVDRSDRGFKIIDYKTGRVPSNDDIASGEAVQLPFYALLMQSIEGETVTTERVEYLSLDANRFGANVFIEGDALNQLQSAVANRLVDIMRAMHQGQGLPAWGDSQTCKTCVMAGLCRKGSWRET